MADNVELNAGSGGSTIATDDDGTAHHQYVKVEFGADNTQTPVSAANPLPVVQTGTHTVELGATDNAVLDDIASDTEAMKTSLAIIDGMVFGAGTEAAAQRVTIATDSTGVLSVDDNGGALTVDNAGTFAVQADTELTTADLDTGAGTDTRAVVGIAGTASGGAQLIPGSSTDGLLVNLGANNDVTISGVATAANQTTIIGHVDGIEGLLTTIDADTGTIAGAVSGTEMQVDVLTMPTVTVDSELTTADLDTGAGTDTRAVVGLVGSKSGGGALIPGDATAGLKVDLGADNDVTVTGTVTASNTAGDVAHDSGDSGNPVKVGGKAGSADQTAVTNNDRTDARFDLLGHQVVRPYALHENLVNGATAAITDTTSTSVIAAQGAGVRTYVTSLSVINADDTTGTVVAITDGSGGTVLWRVYAHTNGGGEAITFPAPLRTTANTALHAVCATTGATVYVSAAGYKAAV